MSEKPLVGIIMGSDSDWPLVKSAVAIFQRFDVAFEARVISAHRTPDNAAEYARTAEERGLQVIISAAGGAAHLGGVLAAHTVLPVIGIPISAGALNGIDALYATLQMPAGIPVAAVTLGSAGAINAALLAVQILGCADVRLRSKFHEYKEELKERVTAANERVNADLSLTRNP